MATIAAQVNALTGISIGGINVATTTELDVWIQDAIVDIVNKSITINPKMSDKFGKWATGQYATTGVDVPSGMVLEVLRETGTASDYARAHQIEKSKISLAQNEDSILYASKMSPVWYFDESSNNSNKVICLPTTSDSGGERYDVKYVHYSTTDVEGDPVDNDNDIYSRRIAYFPSNMQYLVPIYCAIKVLYNYIATEFKAASELFQRDQTDDDASTEAESFMYWLAQEDTEMVQATQIAMGGETQFLTAYLQKLGLLKQEYNDGFGLARAVNEQKQKRRGA